MLEWFNKSTPLFKVWIKTIYLLLHLTDILSIKAYNMIFWQIIVYYW